MTDTNELNKEQSSGLSDLTVKLERALIPTGYLCLHEGGYNHNELPKFSVENISVGLPNDLTRCEPIYSLQAIVDAVELVLSNVKLRGCPIEKG